MDTRHTVVAQFDAPDEAREAMVDLEMKGIDSEAIHLVTPGSDVVANRDVMRSDMAASTHLARRGAKGALLGALIGAAVMLAVLGAARVEPLGTTLVVGVIAGIFGGASIGAYWGAVVRLPANEAAFDSYVAESTDQHGVLVEVTVGDPRAAADAVAVLRRHHPRQIDREVA